jgi:copper chaperone
MSAEDVIKLRVADMTCGHCAQSIVKAIQKGLPAAKVQADPATKLVAVTGVTDATAVRDLVAKAGFTPTAI